MAGRFIVLTEYVNEYCFLIVQFSRNSTMPSRVASVSPHGIFLFSLLSVHRYLHYFSLSACQQFSSNSRGLTERPVSLDLRTASVVANVSNPSGASITGSSSPRITLQKCFSWAVKGEKYGTLSDRLINGSHHPFSRP